MNLGANCVAFNVPAEPPGDDLCLGTSICKPGGQFQAGGAGAVQLLKWRCHSSRSPKVQARRKRDSQGSDTRTGCSDSKQDDVATANGVQCLRAGSCFSELFTSFGCLANRGTGLLVIRPLREAYEAPEKTRVVVSEMHSLAGAIRRE